MYGSTALDRHYNGQSSWLGNTGWEKDSPDYQGFRAMANRSEEVYKALTVGQGIVQDNDTGGGALKVQFLHDLLEQLSYEQKHAVGIKMIPKGKAWSNLLEWTTQDSYGGAGDGFLGESGATGAFDVSFTDDNYRRQTENVRYMAAARKVGLVAQEVKTVADPMKTAKRGATLELIGKANLALYFGDSKTSSLQFNGLARQMMDWATKYTSDYAIMVDCGGLPIDKYILEDASVQNRLRYGYGDLLLQGTAEYGDSQKLLFPEARTREGETGTYGGDKRTFRGANGEIRIEDDPMLRKNRPLYPDGPGSDGKPRTDATQDTGALSFASDPFATIPSVVAPGSGNFWENITWNTDTTQHTKPALPTGDGNQGARLAAGSYYYGYSLVYLGLEGPIYIYGAGDQAANAITGTPTAVAATAGNIVQLDVVAASVTGLGSTVARANLKIRVYRYGGPGAAAPTQVNQFDFLQEFGWPTAGASRCYDNGFYMPGTGNAFLISQGNGGGGRGWEFLELLPLMQRMGLPSLPLADQMVLLWFAVPILWVRRRHIWFRNVGTAVI